jgi:hypothetical protein
VCYLVYFSTTSSEDLTAVVSPHFHVRHTDDAVAARLAHPQRYFLECRFGGCSCHFRHADADLGFGEPEEWYSEDEDDLEPTAAFYDLLLKLRRDGHEVDLFSIFEGTPVDELSEIRVDLAGIKRSEFRFLTDTHVSLR